MYGGSGMYGSGYGSPYASFTNNYSPYGSYSSSYGSYGYRRPDEMGGAEASEFVRRAEEGSRGAFQSIESIVHAVGSVAAMLDSTFHAVYSSFRAVLGVADHFSRLRGHLVKIFSALTVVKILFYVVDVLARWLGLRRRSTTGGNPLADEWNEAGGGGGGGGRGEDQSMSSWPFLIFLAIALGGPFLIWRLIKSTVASSSSSSSSENDDDDEAWVSGNGDHVVVRALYDYDAGNEDELSFRAGDEMQLAPRDKQPKVRGWVLAALAGTRGLVPSNYVKILGKRSGNRSGTSNGGNM